MATQLRLTEQLRAYPAGDRAANDSLIQEIFPRMRRIAASRLRREFDGAQVTPTELVGEAWVSSLHRGSFNIQNREHFFALVGLAMQHILTDRARRRLAERRGNGVRHISLEDLQAHDQPISANAEQVLQIALLLDQLMAQDEEVATVVRLHYLVGLSLEEIASESGFTLRQVRHRWHKGKTWLALRVSQRHAN